jgi:hypothetical protein
MRGQKVDTKSDVFILKDKCYCIDGGQRLWAAGIALRERPDLKINLGVKAFLGTNEDWENDMFCKLGTTQKRVSANVLLRNKMKKSSAARVLVNMNKLEGFALKDRITWNQSRSRHELISGYSFARVAGALHGHKAPLRTQKLYELLAGFDRLYELIGEASIKQNIVKFFEVVDQCWTIRQLPGGRYSRPHLTPAFLITLARLMSNYPNFWDGSERNDFYCPQSYVKKLKGFKLGDILKQSPLVSKQVMYELLRKQLKLDPLVEDSPFDDDEEAA